MRFMIIRKADKDTEAGVMPSEELIAAMARYHEEMVNAGVLRGGEGLQPSATATTVEIPETGGEPIVTDGPFAETKEQLGGFYMIDATDLNEAIQIAAKIPSAKYGTIEVRPVQEFT